MAYQALYRKYRPKNFSEVIGQDHITETLSNQIKNDQISHAYLFCGTRGTGKTSIAKIFARAVNCQKSDNGSPCNECDICVNLSNASNFNIQEIDAASNNGVEYVRELRENVKYTPVGCKYKVYIIDEVHMLSESAFNALLKTLEEPPAYAVFILATTEPHKIPETILSRCMRCDFKLVEIPALEALLKKIFADSKITSDNEAVNLLAKLGEGSVRDTLSLADMCAAFSNNNITYETVVQCSGTTDKATLHELALSVVKGNAKNLLEIIHNFAKAGKIISKLNKDLVEYLRDVVVIQTCENYEKILVYPKNILQGLQTIAKATTSSNIIHLLQKLSSLEQEFRFTTNQKALFEITLLSLLEESSLDARITALEEKIKSLVLP